MQGKCASSLDAFESMSPAVAAALPLPTDEEGAARSSSTHPYSDKLEMSFLTEGSIFCTGAPLGQLMADASINGARIGSKTPGGGHVDVEEARLLPAPGSTFDPLPVTLS